MAKSQTAWTNNNIKTQVTWANNDVKPLTAWANNIAKNQTTYAQTPKNTTTFRSTTASQTPYLYDSSTITYNSAYSYDYISPINNQSNNLNLTPWSAS